MLKRSSQLCLAVMLVCGLASNSLAVFTLSLDASDLSKPGPGPLVFDVDVFINWDGNGNNLLSSLSFDVATPASVVLPDANFDGLNGPDIRNPFNFDRARIVTNTVGFANFGGDVAPLVMGNNRLTTLSFNVNATSGDFPIGLTLVQATQGPAFTDITGQFASVTGGTLSITAVPEPSSMMLVLGLAVGGCRWRQRRRS